MKKTNYIKVIHLLHSDGRGGIEIGAKLGSKVLKKNSNYNVKYIFNLKDNFILRITKSFKTLITLFKEIKKTEKVMIISSLWMSHIIAFILKICLKNLIWISFLHTTKYHDFINFIISTKLTHLSNKRIFDSFSSAKAHNEKSLTNSQIINFYFPYSKASKFKIQNWSKRKYDFIVIARNEKRKGILEIEKFFFDIANSFPNKPKVLIITDKVDKTINLIKIKRKIISKCDITIKTNLTNQKVLKYLTQSKMYVCLSHFEGFGMSVVEAILSGCFVITTNVGEQKYYLYPNRRIILNKKNKYKIKINFINKNGPSIVNFNLAKKYLNKKIKPYHQSLELLINESFNL